MSVPDQVKTYCLEHSLIRPEDRILLAVSGGPDSVALLHIFNSMKKEMKIDISVAHLEHGMRKENSTRDQAFVRRLARELKIDFYTKSVKVSMERRGRESLEEAARRIRYEYLFEIMKSIGYSKIATGHSLDDNIETILYRLVSGTGPQGLFGMLSKTKSIIHPLLELTKKQILSYLDENGFKYRIDHTNFNTDIVRNRIRHELIPVLVSINPKSKEHILNLTKILQEENNIIDALVDQKLRLLLLEEHENRIKIDYKEFFGITQALRRRVLIKIVDSIFSNDGFSKKISIPYRVLVHVCGTQASGNKTLYSNSSLIIRKEYNELIITKRVVNKNDRRYLNYRYRLDSFREKLDIREIERTLRFCLCKKRQSGIYEKNKIYVDYDKVDFPLEIRSRKDGDRIELPTIGNKKVKTIFINDKVPPHMRDEVPVMATENELVGLFCFFYGRENRVARKYMISEDTRRILICELI